MKTVYEPKSELLLTKKNFQLRFTPHLTQIFVKNTENGETTFPTKAYRTPGARFSGSTGSQTVRQGIIYPWLDSRHPGVTNWKKIPFSMHRQVVRILNLKPRTRPQWEVTMAEIREELGADV